MKLVLSFCESFTSDAKTIRLVFMILNVLLFLLIGGIIGGAAYFALDCGMMNLLCIVGYMAVAPGFIGGILYLMRKDIW